MGKIRIALFRDSTAEHVQEDVAPLPLKTAKAHSQADEDKAQELEGLPSYPTQPKTARFDQLPFITADEVVKRDGTRGSDIWIVVDNVVLDVTQYQHQHPGGSSIVRGFAGQDCSWQWWTFHHRKLWTSVASGLRVGRTSGVSNKHEQPPRVVGLRRQGFIPEYYQPS